MPENQLPLVCVDMGTTRTRVWITSNGQVTASLDSDFGARDSDSNYPAALEAQLTELIDAAIDKASLEGPAARPRFIVASGMITSKQGLREIPHQLAPAGLEELAAGVQVFQTPLSTSRALTWALIPGIRISTKGYPARQNIAEADVMRGEETLAAGLLRTGRLQPQHVLFTLGSHWKAIAIDRSARIAASRTTVTGELIHVTQTETLLASSLPSGNQPPSTTTTSPPAPKKSAATASPEPSSASASSTSPRPQPPNSASPTSTEPSSSRNSTASNAHTFSTTPKPHSSPATHP